MPRGTGSTPRKRDKCPTHLPGEALSHNPTPARPPPTPPRISRQLVQPLPRDAENLTAHNSGYVYISCTPFNGGGGVLTSVELTGQSGIWEIHNSFLPPPPRAPRVSPSYLSGPN